MSAERYSYKTLPPEWRNCEAWPAVDLTSYDEDTVSRFERLSRGMRQYLNAGQLRASAVEAGCSRAVLIDLLNRCVHVGDDGELVGWRGLISRLRIRSYTRKAPAAGPEHVGKSGCFEQFLDAHEGLRDQLHKIIQAGGGEGAAKSRSPSLRGVYKKFKKHCVTTGLSEVDYPFNCKYGGRRSVERYAVKFIREDPKSTEVWFGGQAKTGRLLGTGKNSFPFAMEPFDVVGMDAHKMDCIGVVVLNGPAGPQKVPVKRIWIYACVDRRSRTIIGYSVSIRVEISAANVEAAIVSCSRMWEPRRLIVPGMSYPPGAGFPVGSVVGLQECRPCVLLVDNAAQHFANRIVKATRRSLGCAITYGAVGAWWHNPVTERLFRSLAQFGFQALPSSTGSSPVDPLRGKPVAEAVRHCIEWEELIDLVDLILATYNATPHQSLGNQSPLDVLRAHLEGANTPFLPRQSPPMTATHPPLGVAAETRRIGGCAIKGRLVSPYVEIDKVRYTNPELSKRFDLLRGPITVHIDEQDMRKVRGFIEGGRDVGELVALNVGWRTTAHTREMRKAINALIATSELASNSADLVLDYMAFLARKTLAEIRERPGNVSRSATTLADAARVAGKPIPPVPAEANPLRKASLNRPMPGHIKPPSWRSS